jgi:hypothetical protein
MWSAISGVFTSKTTWVVLIGSVVVTLLSFILPHFGLTPEMTTTVISFVGGLFGIKGIQLAASDVGKNKPV